MTEDQESGFTAGEKKCHEHLMKMLDAFMELPREHPRELAEVEVAVHIIQGLLATRIVRRSFPSYWPTYAEGQGDD